MKTLILLSFLFATPVFADETECRSVLHKCDDALRAQQDLNALQKQIIADQEERHQLEAKEIQTQAIWKPIAIGGIVVIGVETLILILRR